MSLIAELLQNVTIPRMLRVRQDFATVEVEDIVGAVQAELRRPAIASRVKPGMRIAVGVGSRGMAEIALIATTVISELKRMGADPFIVPAMGSHGGATAEGQLEVLARLGVTERTAGCPILSSMEVVEVGRLEDGMAVLMDKNALGADGIVVINRIKAHSGFVGPNESGLAKMITIGLGKQKGADACHAMGWAHMARLVVEMAEVKLRATNILFGLGTIENAEERVGRIVAVPAEDIIARERELLQESKRALPRILLDPLDVLIVDQLGKEFSGSGMDPYVTGRAATPYVTDLGINIARIAVLDVSDYSHGNCSGMGIADITTRRLFDKIDFNHTYANTLTSRAPASSRIPLIMPSDELAIKAAIQVSGVPDFSRIRMARIPNTGHIREIYVSEALLPDVQLHPNVNAIGPAQELAFDGDGNLPDVGHWDVQGDAPSPLVFEEIAERGLR
jgi:hypothetical protein